MPYNYLQNNQYKTLVSNTHMPLHSFYNIYNTSSALTFLLLNYVESDC